MSARTQFVRAARANTISTAPAVGVEINYEACFSAVGALVPQYSPPITTPADLYLTKVIITVRNQKAPGKTFRVQVFKDGVAIVNQVIGAAAYFTPITVNRVASIEDTSMWTVYISQCSVDTSDVNVTLRYEP